MQTVSRETGSKPEDFEVYLERIRRFTRDVLRAHEDVVEANDEIPAEIVDQIRDIGLFGISLPKRWSGLGLK